MALAAWPAAACFPGPRAEARPAPARYAFTVVASITVYSAAWVLLHLQGSPSWGGARRVTDQLGVQDVPVFQVSGARLGHPGGPEPRARAESVAADPSPAWPPEPLPAGGGSRSRLFAAVPSGHQGRAPASGGGAGRAQPAAGPHHRPAPAALEALAPGAGLLSGALPGGRGAAGRDGGHGVGATRSLCRPPSVTAPRPASLAAGHHERLTWAPQPPPPTRAFALPAHRWAYCT